MTTSNKFKEHQQRTMQALASIHRGDKVKIVNCLEAESYEGQTFEVQSDPWEICGAWCVKIMAGKGAFDIACLEKVEG